MVEYIFFAIKKWFNTFFLQESSLLLGNSFTLLDNNSGTAYLSKNKIVAQPQQINGKLEATIYF